MEKPVIKRDTNRLIREKIGKLLESTNKNISGFSSEEFLSALNKVDYSSFTIPEKIFKDGFYSSRDLNNFLNMIYLDLLIQYNDIHSLQDELNKVRSFFLNTISPQITRTGFLKSKAESLHRLSSSKFKYTDTIFESFNENVNEYPFEPRLKINPEAGILRLPGIEKVYNSSANMDVQLIPVSSGLKVIDYNDENNVYNADPIKPYYVNAITTAKPVNRNIGSLEFENIDGAIFDLKITFPDVIPINRINFTQFGDAPYTVIQVEYTTIPGQRPGYSKFQTININDISYDNQEIEINFERTNLREIHIYLLQRRYKSTREQVEIAKFKHTKEYINYCTESLRSIDSKGFVENEDIELQLSELFDTIRRNIKFPTDLIPENIRSYTIGLYNLRLSNVLYSANGRYISQGHKVSGNLMNVMIDYDGIPVIRNDNNIACASIFSIETGDNTIHLATKSDNGKIIDIAETSYNYKYENNIATIDDDYPVMFSTHFIPKTVSGNLLDMSIHYDGNIINLNLEIPGRVIIVHNPYSTDVILSDSFCVDNNISPGIFIALEYSTAVNDHYGNRYDPSQCDIITRLGKPNIKYQNIYNVASTYMYTKIDNDIVCYNANEFYPVNIENGVYNCLGVSKGEPPLHEEAYQKVSVSGEADTFYISNKYCSGNYNKIYAGIFNEPLMNTGFTDIIGGDAYYRYQTEEPYILDSIYVYNGKEYIPDIVQYEVDTYGNILSPAEKSIVYILSGSIPSENELYANYIPVDSSSNSIESNISDYNSSENYSHIPKEGVRLNSHPYVDIDVINSELFKGHRGVYSYLPRYSITYEPVTVYVNGIKAINVTRYKESDPDPEELFTQISRADEYMFYISADNILVPDREIHGNISINYYTLTKDIRLQIDMIKSNTYMDDITPEIFNYTILANVVR